MFLKEGTAMKNRTLKALFALALALILTLGALSACTISFETEKGAAPGAADLAAAKNAGGDDLKDLVIDTTIELNDEKTAVTGNGAVFENGVLTISKSGAYALKGKLSDGQILVDTEDEAKVKLLFDGVTIHSSTSAPLLILSSPKETKLLLAEGSENTLSDESGRTAQENDDPDAVIWSKDDLEISGTGTLNAEANYARGIVTRDTLQISGGTLNVTAADDALRGRDGVDISGGVLNLRSGGDGIQASDEDKGSLTVSGGVLSLNTDKDGLQAAAALTISGGVLELTSGGSAIKGAADVKISGGSLSVDAANDGIHADGSLTVSGGSILISECDEGLEGTTVTVSGGSLDITASDDGINAAAPGSADNDGFVSPTGENGAPAEPPAAGVFTPPTGEDGRPPEPPTGESGSFTPPERPEPGEFTPPTDGTGRPQGGFPGGNPGAFGYDAASSITITGGSITVSAGGDGLDSNGDIKMTGGSLTVFGPTNNGNSAIDYGGSFEMTGGTLLAVGAAGMAQSVSSGYAAIAAVCEIGEGDKVELRAKSGKTLTCFAAPKKIGHIVFADGAVKAGESYSVVVNGNVVSEVVGR